VNPFSEDAALEFGESSAHLKHCAACRRAGIESLLMQVKITFKRLQFSQESDQVLQTATKAVHGPGSDHVDLARSRILDQAVECRTFVAAFAAANTGIPVNLNDFPF
jgi:hypothetical protein